MRRQYLSFYASVAALLLIGVAPAAAQTHSQHHAVRATRVAESAKVHATHSSKSQTQHEHATTAVINRDSIVSVGPQASAFRRIRDIAMAPTG
jgi:hypothetical protein